MFWLGILIVAGIALLPALYGLRRLRRRVDARDSALTLYRGQLAELDRDRDLGLVRVMNMAPLGSKSSADCLLPMSRLPPRT